MEKEDPLETPVAVCQAGPGITQKQKYGIMRDNSAARSTVTETIHQPIITTLISLNFQKFDSEGNNKFMEYFYIKSFNKYISVREVFFLM